MDNSTLLVLLIIAAVLALPGGLILAGLLSPARTRWGGLFGGLIGDVAVAAAVYFYVTSDASLSLDGLTYFLGAFFAITVGSLTGAMLLNFLLGLMRRAPDVSSEI